MTNWKLMKDTSDKIDELIIKFKNKEVNDSEFKEQCIELFNVDLESVFTTDLKSLPNKGNWTLEKWIWYLKELKLNYDKKGIENNLDLTIKELDNG